MGDWKLGSNQGPIFSWPWIPICCITIYLFYFISSMHYAHSSEIFKCMVSNNFGKFCVQTEVLDFVPEEYNIFTKNIVSSISGYYSIYSTISNIYFGLNKNIFPRIRYQKLTFLKVGRTSIFEILQLPLSHQNFLENVNYIFLELLFG